MARQRRDLSEQLADIITNQRNAQNLIFGVPEMEAVGPEMIADNAILNEHLSPGAIRLENLDEEIATNLDGLADSLGKAAQDVADLQLTLDETQAGIVDIDIRLGEAASELVRSNDRIDNEILPAINDAAASPITDARMKPGSITVWPFTTGAVPAGAIAPGAVSSKEIADFSLVAKKFKDDRHRIY